MFQFRNLSDSYVVSVMQILSDDSVATYEGIIDLEARRKGKDQYHFVLQGRRDVLVDEDEPEHGSDLIMREIGDSLYPMELTVSNSGKIMDLTNFETIKERWSEKRKELINKYRTFEFEQYLKGSEHNMKNKPHFMKILQRDAFIQFYFLPFEKNTATFQVCHFPTHGYKTTYYATQTKSGQPDCYSLYPAYIRENTLATDGTLTYKRSKEGDVSDMQLNINLLMEDQTYYRRKVSIRKNEAGERIINSWL